MASGVRPAAFGAGVLLLITAVLGVGSYLTCGFEEQQTTSTTQVVEETEQVTTESPVTAELQATPTQEPQASEASQVVLAVNKVLMCITSVFTLVNWAVLFLIFRFLRRSSTQRRERLLWAMLILQKVLH